MSLRTSVSGLRKFNPLRTLAGQLILVTIIAVLLSHVIAWVLFTYERGRSMRALSETSAVERVVGAAERIRESAASDHRQIARASSDISVRFTIVNAPARHPDGRPAPHLATEISQRLGGAETQAALRAIEIEWPPRFIFRHDDDPTHRHNGDHGPGRPPRGPDGRPAPGPDGPPPMGMGADNGPDPGSDMDRFRPPPDRAFDAPPDQGQTRRVDELTIYVALGAAPNGAQEWLRARAFLPTPRPVPTSLWFGALFSVIAVGVAAAIIARRIGQPLAQLTKAAERLGFGDTTAKAPESGPEDVRRASVAFNAMAERLGRQITRQRHMLWALSHDLRTPITALRLRAELLDDEAARQKMLSSLADMESLTEQALALARAGASEEARVRVDLSEIAHTLCGELQELGLNIGAVAPQPVFAECRPDEIVRALRNLAENAQKYAGGGEMHVRREDKTVVIELMDNGPGIAEAELARVTDPFFRADEARSQGAEGVGLGLAIAQAIADSHGGKLILANRSPHGLSAKLVLPA